MKYFFKVDQTYTAQNSSQKMAIAAIFEMDSTLIINDKALENFKVKLVEVIEGINKRPGNRCKDLQIDIDVWGKYFCGKGMAIDIRIPGLITAAIFGVHREFIIDHFSARQNPKSDE